MGNDKSSAGKQGAKSEKLTDEQFGRGAEGTEESLLDCDLLIIDEPLNNLDFVNARHISNLINKVIREHPQMGLLMISHCRIFPFITRELKLTADGISEISEPYTCHSCFGEHDENGFYK